VTVDGTPRGATPLSLRDVALGTHAVQVGLTGYEAETRDVALTAAEPVAALTVDLQAVAGVPQTPPTPPIRPPVGTGTLAVESRPPGAQVLLDGRVVGSTPLTASDLAVGRHEVRIELAGYQVWTGTIEIAAAQRVRIAASLDRLSRP
jgi:hypothetical protein